MENREQVPITRTSLFLKTTERSKQQMRIKHITIQLALKARSAKKPWTVRTIRNTTLFLHVVLWMTLPLLRQLNSMQLLFTLTIFSCGGFQSPLIRVGCLVCVWCVSGVFGASVARQGCPRVFSLSFSPSPSLPLLLSLSSLPPLLSLSLSLSFPLSPLPLSVPPSVSCCGGFGKRGDDQSDHETLLILLLADWTNFVTRLRAVPVDPRTFDTLCKTKNAHHCHGSSPHSSAKLQSNGCLVKVVIMNGAPQTT